MLVNELKKSFLISLWFMFLTFPIMVIRVNTVENIIQWRWANLFFVGIGSFVLSALWRYLIRRKEQGIKKTEVDGVARVTLSQRLLRERRFTIPALIVIAIVALAFPFVFSLYQTNIMITALIYVLLGLGLNIVVGVAGLLDLGYAAFYLVGAYSYALLNYHFGFGFWTVLGLGAGMAALFGIILGFPVLRLRGDYLAIVTLGFGEIIRLIMENWNEFSFGPSGIANIPRPGFFGVEMNFEQVTVYVYFLMIALSLFTIFVVNRLQNSRIGRAWIALREDEVACQAMGIDKRKTKLMAFALGATWAGFAGVVFAAKTTFINPASFTLWESINILCVVVLGGMGSIVGVIVGAFILILLPEYLRFLSEYRILAFGTVLVLMMVFRPGGIVETVRRTYQYEEADH
ncbi:MAG: branched-chain amino acid ABC transporter permease [Desulfosarcina sp.]|nr:branched-chain amino acid ABC transporter permease [Desulfosarcina sp.]MBC2744555.1 branched-chain amino acid ABC transporter permease [Desulfosarcina sp.]MBC2767465.1 branched-chain amino acid ABC transporter permease [Desulfosarcina sp.]